jgi:hypothetical protein
MSKFTLNSSLILQVKRAIHQIPHIRAKRGYRSSDELQATLPEYQSPNDPSFKYQWYLVGYSKILFFSI